MDLLIIPDMIICESNVCAKTASAIKFCYSVPT